MTPFDWREPSSLAEAVSLLDPDDPSVRPVAGGTALMLMMKAGMFTPSRLISLQKVEPACSAVTLSDGGARIGALATLALLERNNALAAAFPVLARTLARLSNPRVRNVACVGGALAHGDPHMDLPPVLAALDARVTLIGPRGAREARVDRLYSGYYETTIGRDELIGEVAVPALQGRRAAYLKITARTADDWPALGVAVAFGQSTNGGLQDVRVVVSAATSAVVRLASAEAVLNGSPVTDALLREAGEAAAQEAPVTSNARGSSGYKRELLRVAVGRAIRQASSETKAH